MHASNFEMLVCLVYASCQRHAAARPPILALQVVVHHFPHLPVRPRHRRGLAPRHTAPVAAPEAAPEAAAEAVAALAAALCEAVGAPAGSVVVGEEAAEGELLLLRLLLQQHLPL